MARKPGFSPEMAEVAIRTLELETQGHENGCSCQICKRLNLWREELERHQQTAKTVVAIPVSLWVRLLHSVALADHVGEVADDLQQFATLCDLPMPPDNAAMDVAPEDQTAENSWLGWAKSLGVENGIWGDAADQEATGKK